MDNENLIVGDSGAGSGAAASQPPASPASPSPIEGIVEQLLPLLSAKLSSQVEEAMKPYMGQLEGLKKVQGNVDRTQSELKTQLAEINKLTKQGMSQEQALEYLDKQNAESEWRTSLEQQLTDLRSLITGNGNGQQQKTVTEVFSKFGLDLKNPIVAPELLKQYKNSDEMETAALRLFYKLQTTPDPNAAQRPAMQGANDGRRTQRDISTISDSSQLYDIAAEEILVK